ncbi:hypothetical protein K435DRAFT_853657 [Dendrothele bispora CBS 962.96]|uniref:Uncharacterized protein n=1 Tax=Dendrothele bispora (strain CBS 962.96) TaxID=1314807 RepID=A0A4S8MFT8_DENBC|nr:hypothetical protein K435DRAFT_853657 [Dendrothele bispora CBS 962.96]
MKLISNIYHEFQQIVIYAEDEFLDDELMKLELYSRNSEQIPFYPGLSSIPIANIPYQPSVDGGKGRFDPTKNPQLFDKLHPYYPFISRPQSTVDAPRKPEDVPAFLVWESSQYPREELGTLLPDYYLALMDRVWRLQSQIREIALDEASASWPHFRSSQPPKPTARNWGEEMTFDQLVDDLALLQRWVKELDAWVRMGNLLRKTPRNPLLCLPDTDTTEADDSILGVWANGMEESDLRGKDGPSATRTQRTSNPFLLTDWQDNKTCQEWIGLARRSRITVDKNDWNNWLADAGREDKSAIRTWRSSSLASTENFPGQDTRVAIEGIAIPNEDRYGPKPVELKTLVEDRVQWIVPPEVVNPDSKGSWSWFVEDTDDEDRRCLRFVGKSARKEVDSSEWPYIYFDRIRKRKLHLYTEIIIPPNLAHNVDVFGLPGPRICYYNDTTMTIRANASDWVYRAETPSRNDIGRRADIPNHDSLPKLPTNTTSSIPSSSIPSSSIPSSPPPAPPSQERRNYWTYANREEEDEILDFGEPTPSPVQRAQELPPMRTPSPPAKEPSPIPVSPTIDNEKSEEDTQRSPEDKSGNDALPPRAPLKEQLISSDEIIEKWLPKLSRRSCPPPAPTCLLRLIGFDGSITELMDLFSKTRQKTAVETRIARINKVSTPEGTEFWVKIWNKSEAGWFIQAHYDLPIDEKRVFEIRLLKLLPYLECPMFERSPDEQWTRKELVPSQNPIPQTTRTPSSPPSSSQTSSLLSRMDIPLQDRLEESSRVPLSLAERIESDHEEPVSEMQDMEPSSSKKKAKSRGGKRHRHWNDILGPVPTRDPQIDMDSWTPELWLSQAN